MKKVIHFLVLSCQKATLLQEKSFKTSLSFKEKLLFKFHLKICDGCSKYTKQNILIEQLLMKNNKNSLISNDFKLSSESKMRIQKVFEDKMNNN